MSGSESTLDRLSGRIDNERLRQQFVRFVDRLGAVHPDVTCQVSPGEARLFFHDVLLCRLVPYRELFHVQIGENPAWETRVKTDEGFLSAFDAALRRLLELYGTGLDVGKCLVIPP